MRTSAYLKTAVTTLMLVSGLRTAQAATLYWDNNSTTAGFGTAGGTWGTEQKWSTDITGVAAPGTTATTTSDDLRLGTTINGLASGTVTISGAAQGLRTLAVGGGSGAITLAGGTLNLAAASGVLLANASHTVGAVLAGSAALHKVATLRHTAFLTSTAALVFRNASLAAYTDADGVMGGAWLNSGAPAPTEAFFFSNNGATATFQFQIIDGTFTKCVKVELTQVGADIHGRVLYARYVNGSQLGYNFDSGAIAGTIATSYAAGGYGAAETHLVTTREHARFLTGTAAAVYTNGRLADVIAVDGIMGGSSISGGAAAAEPYFFSNDGATGTFQLQCFNGGYTKCVKIELTQVGADIQGRVLYAKYYNALNVNVLGYNFDTGGTGNTIATSYGSAGYGAAETFISLVNEGAALTLTGVNTYSGGTRIGGGTLTIGGAGQLGSGTYAAVIDNAGQLLHNSSANQTLSGAIAGTGKVVKGYATAYAARRHTAFLTGTAATIFTGATLADYVEGDGVMGGAWVNGGAPAPAQPYYFSNDGATCAFQLQTLGGGFTKCVKVELTQVGADLAGRVLYAKYVSGSQLGYNFDTGGNVGTIATSYAADGYGAAEVSLTTYYTSTLTLSAANTYSGGTDVNAGTLAATTTASALPPSGAITVANAGELWLAVASGMSFDNAGGVGNGNPLTVNSGGTLTLAAPFNAGYSRPITVNGGTLNTTAGTSANGENYVNNLTLRNGAQVTGNPNRVGFHSAATIAASGTGASTHAAGMLLANNGGLPLTFNVADATGTPAADLTVSGSIGNLAGYTGMPVIKAGIGTLVFSGANTYVGTTRIDAGTLQLGANNTLDADNPVVLNGGALAAGAFNNTLGTLTVQANSQIALGAGQLAFADSSAVAWTGHLALVGTLGPQTLRVGNDDSDLTSAQIRNISINGHPVAIDANGYLMKASQGSMFQIR